MKFNVKNIEVINKQERWFLLVEIPRNLIDKLTKLKEKDCFKSVEVKEKKDKRSLDANAALWVMLAKMADVLRTSKEELYLIMLERYGVFTHIVVKPEAVYRILSEWKTGKILGDVTVNGKKGVQLQLYYGSSTYNTKEFSVLLDGVIEEAKKIGVDFISKADRDLMLKEWDNE